MSARDTTTRDASPPALHPLFLKLEGRAVLVVGGGPVALEKAQSLARAGARVHVVAPDVHPELAALAVRVSRRTFAARDVRDAWLVIAAAPPTVNRAVARAADKTRSFVVAVDDPSTASAFGASTFTKDGVTVALSSSGRAPALVALLRRAIEAVLPDDLAEWQAAAARARHDWKAAAVPIAARRPLLLRALNALYTQSEAS